MKYVRSIALIGDTHVGSNYALFPNNPKKYNIILNSGQKSLLSSWNDFWANADKYSVDTIIHLGDCLDGYNKKEFGAGLTTTDLNIQKDAFVELMKPHIKKRRFYILSGSGYHQSLDYRFADAIADELNGTFLGDLANVKLKGTNLLCNLAHGSGGTAIYRATVLDRESLFMLSAQAVGKLEKTDIVIRGHLHYYMHQENNSMNLLQVPCWKTWQPNKIFLPLYGRKQPDIGGIIMLIESDMSVYVKKFLYPLPHIADATFTG